jgi:hypothetical protein
VRLTFLPDDETCFYIFEAASEEAVWRGVPARGDWLGTDRPGGGVSRAGRSTGVLGR